MTRLYILIAAFCFMSNSSAQKSSFLVDIYLPNYGTLSLPDSIQLNDTIKVEHSGNTYFKFVFFSTQGRSFCQVYRNNKLYEEGYYENSIDTLKKYVSGRGSGGFTHSKIYVRKYFQPLKDGDWVEFKNGKRVRKKYIMGIEIDK